MPSLFNPEMFMESAIQGANDTKITPCPVGEWPAIVEDVKVQAIEVKDGENAGDVTGKLNVFWITEDPEVVRVTGRPKVRVRQEMFLDLTEDGSGLDMGKGKNVRLGKLREAVGLNNPSVPFMFRQLIGQYGIIKTGQRADKKDSSIIYDEVLAVRRP